MRNLGRCALNIGAAALLAGCVGPERIGTSSPMPLQAGVVRATATESVVYSFAGGKDGAVPEAAPISMNGELYGTTALGGDAGCVHLRGCGTVYELDSSGEESVLYAFTSVPDGEAPQGLINVAGTLYGPSVYGGASACKSGYAEGCGTVYEVAPSGKERVLYRFGGKAQGAAPVSALTSLNGVFYGQAAAGGAGKCSYADQRGCGLIFEMNRAGKVNIVYTFKGGKSGGTPQGGLIAFKGNLYGTTSGGGGTSCYFNDGCGTAFKIAPSGTETVLHDFGRTPYDGAVPETGLISLNGAFYGTTLSGGANDCALYGSPYGCGTVFRLTPSGREKIIYSFQGSDGYFPNGLIGVGGKLYGTTQGRGFYKCGTVFELTTSAQETTLYQFKGGTDGCGPSSGLTDVNGTLYGTTEGGGAYGYGTVFALTLQS